MQKLFYFASLFIFASACKVQKSLQQDSKLKQVSTVQQPLSFEQQAKQSILEKPELIPAHVGISLFDSKTERFIFFSFGFDLAHVIKYSIILLPIFLS